MIIMYLFAFIALAPVSVGAIAVMKIGFDTLMQLYREKKWWWLAAISSFFPALLVVWLLSLIMVCIAWSKFWSML